MITKNIQTPNGTATYHVLFDIGSKRPFSAMTLTVNSYADETIYIAGGSFLYQYRMGMPANLLSGDLQSCVEGWLITDPTSAFQGGVIVADKSNTLDAAKDRAWTAIKAARASAEAGNFTYDGGVYQINVPQINACVTLAMLAKQTSQPYTITWTLTGNSRKEFDADQMIAMGAALGAYIQSLYAKARTLRDALEAATTIEDAVAVKWE